jgi:hypothetical protein
MLPLQNIEHPMSMNRGKVYIIACGAQRSFDNSQKKRKNCRKIPGYLQFVNISGMMMATKELRGTLSL